MGLIYGVLGIIMVWCLIYPVPDYYNRLLAWNVIKKGCSTRQEICLTFDDGPDPRYTPAVLEILRQKQISATFFLVGRKVEASPEIVKTIQDDGHEIGLHSYLHKHAYGLWIRQSFRSIRVGREIIERITGQPLVWFRPPWGALNLFQLCYFKRSGLKMVLWSAMGQDWDIRTGPDGIMKRLKDRVGVNSIIVLHDSGGDPGAPANTLKALPEVITYYQNQGYRFVTLSEIVGGNC
jgi:peptidoglycan/xylan/chitin deacetylase (PgdA/CDA1 family)